MLFVSTGKAAIPVPDVSNLTPQAAIAKLNLAGFETINQPPTQESSNIQQGLVTRTDPPANKSVSPDTTITIFESSGPATVTVPPETGKTLAAAKADLLSKGFQVSSNVPTQTVTDPQQDGKVVGMNPNAGTQVAPNTSVTLTIGVFTPPGSTTTTSF